MEATLLLSSLPAAASFSQSSSILSLASSSSGTSCSASSASALVARRKLPICFAKQEDQDSYVMYDEKKSVFPAEACEEVGGEACDALGVGPEVKGKSSSTASSKASSSSPSPAGQDREYVEYSKEAKTVFPGEACDELGGEFCEPEYQAGVFPEKASASSK